MDAPEDVPSDDSAALAPTWFRRRRRGRLQRSVAALTGGVAVYGFAALLSIPPLIFLSAGIWSIAAYTRTLFSLWDLLRGGQLQEFLNGLSGADLSVRLAMASGAYFALLFALIVIFSGLLGRKWRLLLLVPGLLLAAPAFLIFLTGMQVAAETLTPALALPDFLAPLATIYALFDLVVLAAFLTDLRPRLSRRRRRTRVAEQANVLVPILRFGPPVALPIPALAAATMAPEQDFYDETPSDPRMTVSVAKALDESLSVAILPVPGVQRDEPSTVPALVPRETFQDEEPSAPERNDMPV